MVLSIANTKDSIVVDVCKYLIANITKFGDFDDAKTVTVFSVYPPSADIECVILTVTGTSGYEANFPYEEYTFQLLARSASAESAFDYAVVVQQLFFQTGQVLTGFTLPSGRRVSGVKSLNGPVYSGQDENERHMYSMNFVMGFIGVDTP